MLYFAFSGAFVVRAQESLSVEIRVGINFLSSEKIGCSLRVHNITPTFEGEKIGFISHSLSQNSLLR
jgi:hypothetical protein